MDDQSFEVNLIEELSSEHEEGLEYESDHEFDLESDDFNLDQIVESTVEWQMQPQSFLYKKNNP